MSVLIKGAKMPINCKTCDYVQYEDEYDFDACHWFCPLVNEGVDGCLLGIPDFCPLVEIPSADVVEVRHAYDIERYSSMFECSNCGWTCEDTYPGEPCVDNGITYNYCPNCGAKIDYKRVGEEHE